MLKKDYDRIKKQVRDIKACEGADTGAFHVPFIAPEPDLLEVGLCNLHVEDSTYASSINGDT